MMNEWFDAPEYDEIELESGVLTTPKGWRASIVVDSLSQYLGVHVLNENEPTGIDRRKRLDFVVRVDDLVSLLESEIIKIVGTEATRVPRRKFVHWTDVDARRGVVRLVHARTGVSLSPPIAACECPSEYMFSPFSLSVDVFRRIDAIRAGERDPLLVVSAKALERRSRISSSEIKIWGPAPLQNEFASEWVDYFDKWMLDPESAPAAEYLFGPSCLETGVSHRDWLCKYAACAALVDDGTWPVDDAVRWFIEEMKEPTRRSALMWITPAIETISPLVAASASKCGIGEAFVACHGRVLDAARRRSSN